MYTVTIARKDNPNAERKHFFKSIEEVQNFFKSIEEEKYGGLDPYNTYEVTEVTAKKRKNAIMFNHLAIPMDLNIGSR